MALSFQGPLAGAANAFLADLSDGVITGLGSVRVRLARSGSWTMMNLRLPPSSAFNCITASAVEPEPQKKSITNASGSS